MLRCLPVNHARPARVITDHVLFMDPLPRMHHRSCSWLPVAVVLWLAGTLCWTQSLECCGGFTVSRRLPRLLQLAGTFSWTGYGECCLLACCLLACYMLLCTACCLLPAACCLLPTCLLYAMCCLLPAACCLLSAVCFGPPCLFCATPCLLFCC